MNTVELYYQVGLRHAQFQDGAITYSEFCNTLIILGLQHRVIVIAEGSFEDAPAI